MDLHRQEFPADDLIRVDDSRAVILASGGPLMTLEAVEGENAVVSWEWAGDGGAPVRRRAMLPVATLRRPVCISVTDAQRIADGRRL